MKNRKINKEKTKPIIRFSFEKVAFVFIWAGLLIILFAIFSIIFREFNYFGITTKSFELLGQFGEYVGGLVGSIWALAGVILFYETLRFQRTELRLQREELQNQRSEIMEQTRQYIIQNQTLMTRKLEGTFFQLISLHNEIVDSLKLNFKSHPKLSSPGNKNIEGRYCFNFFYKYFAKTYSDNIDLTGMTTSKQEDAIFLINESFKVFYFEFQEDIGHYFRNLYNLSLYVDKSNMSNKRFYYNLIRSLLSNYEIILLFYYCLSQSGGKMKKLAERYSLFAQIPEQELLDRRHKELFNKKAFEEDYDIVIDEEPEYLRRTYSPPGD
ncbi:MAG: putative phage abortive infection protein [bacterium]